MTNVIYTPDKKAEKENYWEVWQGLPEVEFKPANSRDGSETLKYEQDGDYIWVPNNALNALKQNSQTILLALNSRQSNSEKMNVRWLSTQEGNLEKAIEKAKRLNGEN